MTLTIGWKVLIILFAKNVIIRAKNVKKIPKNVPSVHLVRAGNWIWHQIHANVYQKMDILKLKVKQIAKNVIIPVKLVPELHLINAYNAILLMI
jgi:hypothetical protein